MTILPAEEVSYVNQLTLLQIGKIKCPIISH